MKTTCLTCNRLFTPSAPNQIYCSARCRETNYRRRARHRSQLLSPGKEKEVVVFNRVPTEEEELSIFQRLIDNPMSPPFLVPRPSSSRVIVPPGLTYHEEYNPDKQEFFYYIEWDRQLLAEYRSDPDSTLTNLIEFYGFQPTHPLPLKNREATVSIFTKATEHRQPDALAILNKHLK